MDLITGVAVLREPDGRQFEATVVFTPPLPDLREVMADRVGPVRKAERPPGFTPSWPAPFNAAFDPTPPAGMEGHPLVKAPAVSVAAHDGGTYELPTVPRACRYCGAEAPAGVLARLPGRWHVATPRCHLWAPVEVGA